ACRAAHSTAARLDAVPSVPTRIWLVLMVALLTVLLRSSNTGMIGGQCVRSRPPGSCGLTRRRRTRRVPRAGPDHAEGLGCGTLVLPGRAGGRWPREPRVHHSRIMQ